MSNAAFDLSALRGTMGSFLTGVTIVTTRTADGETRGFTANSFTTVSLDPPLVLVCLAEKADSYEAFSKTGNFVVNILQEDQRDIAMRFASKRQDKFDGVSVSEGALGSPVIDGAICSFECSTHDRITAGDHLILIGKVERFGSTAGRPLGYFRGGFVAPGMLDDRVAAHAETGTFVGAIAAYESSVMLVRHKQSKEWVLPHASVSAGTSSPPQDEMIKFIGKAGSTLTLSFLYSVFERGPSGRVYVIYRGNLDRMPDQDTVGDYEVRMFAQDQIPWDELDMSLYGAVLKRYFEELRTARFGVYTRFGERQQLAILQ